MSKTRVVIVDDSALVRRLLSDILNSDPQIEVVACAKDAFAARKEIKEKKPHVITLDVEMPKMDGITFLRNLMRLHPMPVIMISTLTEKGANVTMQALEYGAIDFIPKPKIDISHSIEHYAEEIIDKVKQARYAKVQCFENTKSKLISTSASTSTSLTSAPKTSLEVSPEDDDKRFVIEQEHSVDEVLPIDNHQHVNYQTTEQIVAIGASTGGTEAVRSVIEELPANFPGIVVTQHIPSAFSAAFAKRMNASSAMVVNEAKDGQQIMRGHVYVAPGGQHLLVVRDGAIFRCKLSNDMPVNRHRPSVDVLFRSVAQSLGQNTLGIILTGMGKDGAVGIKEIQEAGAYTIAQDEASSVVWGMPGEAVKLGGINKILPLNLIAKHMQELNVKRESEVASMPSQTSLSMSQ
ncbi:MAG: chemotaxis response regulator protein-glutamate methylesterase [Gammaproteobacteria bacterium]